MRGFPSSADLDPPCMYRISWEKHTFLSQRCPGEISDFGPIRLPILGPSHWPRHMCPMLGSPFKYNVRRRVRRVNHVNPSMQLRLQLQVAIFCDDHVAFPQVMLFLGIIHHDAAAAELLLLGPSWPMVGAPIWTHLGPHMGTAWARYGPKHGPIMGPCWA